MCDLTHDEGTLRKVYDALMGAGVSEGRAVDIVHDLQNQGIYFRERGGHVASGLAASQDMIVKVGLAMDYESTEAVARALQAQAVAYQRLADELHQAAASITDSVARHREDVAAAERAEADRAEQDALRAEQGPTRGE